jgi:hypothetical protein
LHLVRVPEPSDFIEAGDEFDGRGAPDDAHGAPSHHDRVILRERNARAGKWDMCCQREGAGNDHLNGGLKVMRYTSCRRSIRVAVGLTGLFASFACDSTPKAAESAASPATKDPRTAVALPADGQQAVLHEMRQMLGAVGGALAAAAREDTSGVIAALAPAGSAAAADPALEALLPPTWQELAERTHLGFDSLTAAVRRARSGRELKDTVLAGVARISGSCTTCHETFRITVR